MKAEARGRFWFPGVDVALERLAAAGGVCLNLKKTSSARRAWSLLFNSLLSSSTAASNLTMSAEPGTVLTLSSLFYLMVLIDSHTISKSVTDEDTTDEVDDSIRGREHPHPRALHDARPRHHCTREHTSTSEATQEKPKADKHKDEIKYENGIIKSHKSTKKHSLFGFWRKNHKKIKKKSNKQHSITVVERTTYPTYNNGNNKYIPRNTYQNYKSPRMYEKQTRFLMENSQNHLMNIEKRKREVSKQNIYIKNAVSAVQTELSPYYSGKPDIEFNISSIMTHQPVTNQPITAQCKNKNLLAAVTTKLYVTKNMYANDNYTKLNNPVKILKEIQPNKETSTLATTKKITTTTENDVHFFGTAQIEAMLNEIKIKAMKMVSEQNPAVTNFISNTVIEATFEADPILRHIEVGRPNYTSGPIISFSSIGNDINKRTVYTTEPIQVKVINDSIFTNKDATHVVAARSVQEEIFTIAHNIEDTIKNKIKKVYKKVKNRVSSDFKKEMKVTKTTLEKKSHKLANKFTKSKKTTKPSLLTRSKSKAKSSKMTTPRLCRGTSKSINIAKMTNKELGPTTNSAPFDDYNMLSLYEQILSKTHQDNVMKMLATTELPIAKRKYDSKLSKRSLGSNASLNIKNVMNKIDENNGVPDDFLYYNSNEETEKVPMLEPDYTSKSTTESTGENTSYEGLSNKLSYKEYVNGYKHYLKYQKEQGNEKFSNLVRYQAHRHHNVDDIGKYILNKIPQVPLNRLGRNIFEEMDTIDDQDISTKSDDSWFKKHFYFFLDKGPSKKFHTSQTINLKSSVTQSNDIQDIPTTINTLKREKLKNKAIAEIADTVKSGGKKDTISTNLEELSNSLNDYETTLTYNNLPFQERTPEMNVYDDISIQRNFALPTESTFTSKEFMPQKIIDKFFGNKEKKRLDNKRTQNIHFNEDIKKVKRHSNKNNSLKKDFGYADTTLVTQPTVVLELRPNNGDKSIRHFFKNIRFSKLQKKNDNSKKRDKRQYRYRQQRFYPFNKLKHMFSKANRNISLNTNIDEQDDEIMRSHIDTFKPVKYNKLPSIEDMKSQIPNISNQDYATIGVAEYLKYNSKQSTTKQFLPNTFQHKFMPEFDPNIREIFPIPEHFDVTTEGFAHPYDPDETSLQKQTSIITPISSKMKFNKDKENKQRLNDDTIDVDIKTVFPTVDTLKNNVNSEESTVVTTMDHIKDEINNIEMKLSEYNKPLIYTTEPSLISEFTTVPFYNKKIDSKELDNAELTDHRKMTTSMPTAEPKLGSEFTNSYVKETTMIPFHTKKIYSKEFDDEELTVHTKLTTLISTTESTLNSEFIDSYVTERRIVPVVQKKKINSKGFQNGELTIHTKLTRIAKIPLPYIKTNSRDEIDLAINNHRISSLLDDNIVFNRSEPINTVVKFGDNSISDNNSRKESANLTFNHSDLKRDSDFHKYDKPYPDHFNDLLVWHNDILNTDRITSPSWEILLKNIKQQTDYTGPNLRYLQKEVGLIREYLKNHALANSSNTNEYETFYEINDNKVKYKKMIVPKSILKTLGVDDKTDYRYRPKQYLKAVNSIRDLNRLQLKRGLTPHNTTGVRGFKRNGEELISNTELKPVTVDKEIDDDTTVLVDTTLLAYDDAMTNAMNNKHQPSSSFRKLNNLSLKNPVGLHKTKHLLTPVSKMNHPPPQYYSTPLPMRTYDFEKFLRDNQLDVESVTTPMMGLPSALTLLNNRRSSKVTTHKGSSTSKPLKDSLITDVLTFCRATAETNEMQSTLSTGIIKPINVTKHNLKSDLYNVHYDELKENDDIYESLDDRNKIYNDVYDYSPISYATYPSSKKSAKKKNKKKYYNKFKLFNKNNYGKVDPVYKEDPYIGITSLIHENDDKNVEITIINLDNESTSNIYSGSKQNEPKTKITQVTTTPRKQHGTNDNNLKRIHNKLLYDEKSTPFLENAIVEKKTTYIEPSLSAHEPLQLLFNQLGSLKRAVPPKRVQTNSHSCTYDFIYNDPRQDVKYVPKPRVHQTRFARDPFLDKFQHKLQSYFKKCTTATTEAGTTTDHATDTSRVPETTKWRKDRCNRTSEPAEQDNHETTHSAHTDTYCDLLLPDGHLKSGHDFVADDILLDITTIEPEAVLLTKMKATKDKEKSGADAIYMEATETYTEVYYKPYITKKHKMVLQNKERKTTTTLKTTDTSRNTNKVNKPKNLSMEKAKALVKQVKRNVSTQKSYTAKNVAALEVIIDLVRNTESYEEKEELKPNPNRFIQNVRTETTVFPEYAVGTNAIQVHIAIPYNLKDDKKRSSDFHKIRKIFAAKMSTPVDLEYQVNSFENHLTTDTVIDEPLSSGAYLLINNGNGNFALKSITRYHNNSNIKVRQAEVTKTTMINQNIETTSSTKNLGKVTLSKDIIAAVNKHLVELYENLTDLNNKSITNHNVKARNTENYIKTRNMTICRRHIDWKALKKYFSNERVCSCRCKANRTMCRACAASDAVISELIFEFNNIAQYMKDHCTEIQTYFWMNPSGGKKLRDTVHKVDKSLQDYYKRVKGKCQGRTCKTFSSYIDKRAFVKQKKLCKDYIGNPLIQDLQMLSDDLENISKVNVCLDEKLKAESKLLLTAVKDCISKTSQKRSPISATTDQKPIKHVYSLDNINVNIICDPSATNLSENSYVTTETSMNNIMTDMFDYYINNHKETDKNFLKHLFSRCKSKHKKHLAIRPNYKREVQPEQIEIPLIADTGGSFWYDYINKRNTFDPRIVRQTKTDANGTNGNSQNKIEQETNNNLISTKSNSSTKQTQHKSTMAAAEQNKNTLTTNNNRAGETKIDDKLYRTDSSVNTLSFDMNKLFKIFSNLTDLNIDNITEPSNSNFQTNPISIQTITTSNTKNILKLHENVKEIENKSHYKTNTKKMSHKATTTKSTKTATTNPTIPTGTSKSIKPSPNVNTNRTKPTAISTELPSSSIKELNPKLTTTGTLFGKLKLATVDFINSIGKENYVIDNTAVNTTKIKPVNEKFELTTPQININTITNSKLTVTSETDEYIITTTCAPTLVMNEYYEKLDSNVDSNEHVATENVIENINDSNTNFDENNFRSLLLSILKLETNKLTKEWERLRRFNKIKATENSTKMKTTILRNTIKKNEYIQNDLNNIKMTTTVKSNNGLLKKFVKKFGLHKTEISQGI
ncbi:uncharacterized protein LOC131855257 [Achroia grisella]|uniref:uncharacterized protein LOC131855257 n=1 Tax=Achroia grisella TaxID=688607 RepID=UPI0027D24A62|nr:uncharacterized protein LOC131855257 [Achroia grisella]